MTTSTKAKDQLINIQRRTLVEGLNTLFTEKILCDTILEADDEQFKVHKSVLAACSPYFKAMFTFEIGNSEKVVKLHNIAGPILCDILRFFYTGHIDVDDNSIQALTSAAHMLQIEPLLTFCSEYMSHALCAENCLDVFMFADFLCLPSLKEKAESYVLDNLLSIYQTEQFSKLDCSTLSALLRSDDLNVTNEELVFEAIMIWLKHDLEVRKKDLLLLLLCVRFPLISSEYIENVVSRENLIMENALVSHLVNGFRTCVEEKSETSTSFSATPRLGMYEKDMLVFSGGAFSFSERAFTCMDLDTFKCYQSIEPHPSFDFKFKLDLYRLVVTPKNEIYCLGGIFYDDYHFQRDSGEALDSVLQYDQKHRIWKPQPSMPQGKCGFAACCHMGKMYVFGGYQCYPRDPPTDQTLCFDTETETWTHCQDMPLKMALQAVASVDDRAFLFGGKDDTGECLPLVLQYKYDVNQWTVVNTSIPKSVSDATAVVYGRKIYLMGGSNTNGYNVSVFLYEPENQRWSFCADFPEHRKLLSITGARNSIYVCGGVKHLYSRPGASRSRSVESKDLYRYNIDKNVWTKEVRHVENGNCYTCCAALVNIKFLTPSKNLNV